MFNLFQIGELGDVNTSTYDDACRGLGPIVRIIRRGLFPIIQIAIPIILIVLGTIDLGKAVIASDDKKIQEAQKMLIKRAIYAVAIFFVATIVYVLMGVVADYGGNDNWKACWESKEVTKDE